MPKGAGGLGVTGLSASSRDDSPQAVSPAINPTITSDRARRMSAKDSLAAAYQIVRTGE